MKNKFILEQFVPSLLEAFLQKGKLYLVSQTYTSEINPNLNDLRQMLILCHYSDATLAKAHLHAVRTDKYAAIIDLQRPAHRERVLSILQPDSGYLVFAGLVENRKELTDRADNKYAENLRRYVKANSNWRIGNKAVKLNLELIFGELYVILKFGDQSLRVRLLDIEKT